ncbi:unnamed protein product [Calicophoron daubneyi]|uniref:WW domain-containing protein n=1 Tax=Calicophoron daubneyi TaxID=300641 RepID=A0AAV2TGH2_CALDB
MSAVLWEDSDSDNELPAGWDEVLQENGYVFYRNCATGLIQATHPISGLCKQVSTKLPTGWHTSFDSAQRPVYVNSNTGQFIYFDPRLGSAGQFRTTVHSHTNWKQKFDKFSTADEVLLGKDLRGQFIVVTGAGCGLGRHIAFQLVSHGATVICACSKCPVDAQPLWSSNASRSHCSVPSAYGQMLWIPCDLRSLSSVLQFTKVFRASGIPLHACVFAADAFPPPQTCPDLLPHKPGCWPSLPMALWDIVKTAWNFLSTWFAPLRLVKNSLEHWFPVSSCTCSSAFYADQFTVDGFETCMQQNLLAPLLLVQSLVAISEESGDLSKAQLKIVFLSGEAHRAIPVGRLNDLSEYYPFRRAPCDLSMRLEQYAISQLSQLLILDHLQQWLRSQRVDRSVAVCASNRGNPLDAHCMGALFANLERITTDTILLLFRILRLFVGPFTKSTSQVAASPIFCCTDNKFFIWRSICHTGLSYRRKRKSSVIYIDNCRPRQTMLDLQSEINTDLYAQKLWDITQSLLSAYLDAQGT